MTTKQDVMNARDNYLKAASEMQTILRQLDGIIENGKRGVLVVASVEAEIPSPSLTERIARATNGHAA